MTEPRDLSDRRWRALFDADAAGEPLSPAERAFLGEHRGRAPDLRAEQAFYRQLAARAAAPADEPADDLVAASLAALAADPNAAPIDLSSRPPAHARRWPWVLGAGLLAAGLAGLWVVRPAPVAPTPPAPLALAPAPAPAPAPEPVPDARPAAPAPALALRAGSLRAPAGELPPGAALPAGVALRAGDVEACLAGQGASTLCLQPGAEARLADDGGLALVAGAARVDASGVTAIGVQVAGVRFTSDDGAFVLRVEADTWSAEVERGDLTIADDRGTLARLGPGDSLRRGGRTAPAPTLDAPVPGDTSPAAAPARPRPRPARPLAERLDEARRLRAAGSHAEAARAYEALIAAEPDAPAATAALVALGQLYLGRLGDPAAALRSFDRYLQRAPGGALAEEAGVGRIDALRRLGRAADERAAIVEFLARFPASNYADGLRKRLAP